MSQIRLAVFAILTVLVFPLAWADVPWVAVVDSCNKQLAVIDAEAGALAGEVDLTVDIPESCTEGGEPVVCEPVAVALSTIPDDPGEFAYVLQGKHLRVIKLGQGGGGFELSKTIDLSDFVPSREPVFRDLAGAPALDLSPGGGEGYQSALFIVGSENRGDAARPIFLVLDQEILVSEGSDTPFLAWDSACSEFVPDCRLKALDVHVSGFDSPGVAETAFITLRSEDGRSGEIMALSRASQATGPWSRQRIQREDIKFPALPYPRLQGIDGPNTRPGAHSVFQARGEVVSVGEGGGACQLDEAVVDVAVWGKGPPGFRKSPDSYAFEDFVLFVYPDEGSALVKVDDGQCPTSDAPEPGQTFDQEILVGKGAVGLAIVPSAGGRARIFVANKVSGSVSWMERDIFDVGYLPSTIPLAEDACPEDIASAPKAADTFVIDDLMLQIDPVQGPKDCAYEHCLVLSWGRGALPEDVQFEVFAAEMGIRDGSPPGSNPRGLLIKPKPTGPWEPLFSQPLDGLRVDVDLSVDEEKSFAYLVSPSP